MSNSCGRTLQTPLACQSRGPAPLLCSAKPARRLACFYSCLWGINTSAAHLAAPQQRGRVVGTVVAGILFGVLLARTFSGSIGALLGWRAVYGIAAGAMLILAVVVRTKLPVSRPEVVLSWPELIRSTLQLVRQHV